MLSHIQGEQWLTQSLGQKLTRASKSASEKDPASWDPTPEELREGIDYINSNAPLANGKNEQFLWALLNVRDKDSPIFTWPMHVVSKACQNRTLGNSQAEPEFFFPLLISDLNAAFVEKILPLIVPTMPTHGLILLGRAGIGKLLWPSSLPSPWQDISWHLAVSLVRSLVGEDPNRSTAFVKDPVNCPCLCFWTTPSCHL